MKVILIPYKGFENYPPTSCTIAYFVFMIGKFAHELQLSLGIFYGNTVMAYFTVTHCRSIKIGHI